MRRPSALRKISIGVATLALAVTGLAGPVPAGASGPSSAAAGGASVPARPKSMVDCNGHSPMYPAVKPGLGGLCTDPKHIDADGDTYRFVDNGVYIGHDEPSVKFISSRPGSANTMTYRVRLAVDPKATPTATSTAVSKYAELSIAPWFGLPLCDPKSYPQNPCKPDSDSNSGAFPDPNAAGSAFMELQLYPPGFAPFTDSVSCDPKRYCAALTIDSLACTFGFATCNTNCEEPVNFAFLQRNGVPTAPPSPQLSNPLTFTPNRHTLMMNQGDRLTVTMHDTPRGFFAGITDLSTGQSGYMVASAANGFMNTNIADCSGTPFSFHPEYDTAQKQNQVPWAALEGGVLMQTEIGHFETCSSVSNSLPSQFSAGGHTFSDPQVFQTCNGGSDSANGEGPCDPTTAVCQNATTQTGAACPTDNFASGALCEFSDANCMPAGTRTVTVDGNSVPVTWPVAGCLDNIFQNGDLDFEGTSYQPDWPDGTAGHPTSFEYRGPFTSGGATYPTVQFETDVGGSEALCDVATGTGCTAPPIGAAFYPFWSLGRASGFRHVCSWNFGNAIPGRTTTTFGGPAQYGASDTAQYGGTLISAPLPNPQLSTRC